MEITKEIAKRTTIKIDPDIKRHMKAHAAIADLTLAEAVEQALDEWLIKRKESQNE